MTISGCYLGAMSKQEHQDGRTAHLRQKDIEHKGEMVERRGGHMGLTLDVWFSFSSFTPSNPAPAHLSSFMDRRPFSATELLHKGPAHYQC